MEWLDFIPNSRLTKHLYPQVNLRFTGVRCAVATEFDIRTLKEDVHCQHVFFKRKVSFLKDHLNTKPLSNEEFLFVYVVRIATKADLLDLPLRYDIE
jgi:hypothetical protein